MGLEEPETSAVGEVLYQAPGEMLVGSGEEGTLVEMSVDILTAAAELLEL
jgi:hypothetical protein